MGEIIRKEKVKKKKLFATSAPQLCHPTISYLKSKNVNIKSLCIAVLDGTIELGFSRF